MDPFDIDHEVEISPKGVRRLRSGHLWVYSGDINKEPEEPGIPLVRVVDAVGNMLGYGFYSRKSKIRLRLLSRPNEPPSEDLIRVRVESAIARRRELIKPGTACRLIFGEADLLPSVIVDRYDDYLVIQTLSFGAEAIKASLVEVLIRQLYPAGIIERNDVRSRHLEGLGVTRSTLFGHVPPQIEITEGDIKFFIDAHDGQKTGFYLDQRENRLAARKYAWGRGLDCFTYTGAFALALAQNCEEVVGIDISSSCLEQAKKNAFHNSMGSVTFSEGNVFDKLRELESSGEHFDTICLDPPAFAKSRASLTSAIGGYKEINLRALKLLNQNGVLITSSCSHHLSEPDFYSLIHQAAVDARRYIQVVERRSQASDHPILTGMPETHYLKCFIIRAL